MIRSSLFCFFGMLLVSSVGCQLNRSVAAFSPSQIISSEQSRKGVAALERGDLDDAEKRLEDAVKKSKNDINYRRHYAEVLWQQGKHHEALQQLNEAVRRGGKHNAALYLSLAEKYLAIREYTTAYRYADEAVRLASHDYQSWALRGRAKRLQAVHQGNAEQSIAMLHQAREDYLRAVSLAPNDRELLTELAAVQMGCGQPEQALATWLTVQKLYPQGKEPAEVLIGKTETLTVLHRLDEAEANLAVIRQRGLEHSEAWQHLQQMMAAQGGFRR
jgi:tetratricopeptide (TPR) repeat protein